MGPIVVSNVVLVCTVKWWLFSYQPDECFRNAGFCQASSVAGHHAGHDGKVRDERRLHVNEQWLLAVADLSEDAHTVGGLVASSGPEEANGMRLLTQMSTITANSAVLMR
jgi:hypothetical protein